MYIILGKAKGRKLEVLGMPTIRPTMDRARSAVFSILATTVNQASILDLYAGSGAMGIEALSRGAENCDFVEKQTKACDIIQTNLENTQLDDRGNVYCMTAIEYLSHHLANLDRYYDLIFMDPPYDSGSVNEVFGLLLKCISAHGMVIYEHSRHREQDQYPGWALKDNRHYGKSYFDFLTKA